MRTPELNLIDKDGLLSLSSNLRLDDLRHFHRQFILISAKLL